MDDFSRLPRGIRNHNPGNLERNHIKWRGMAALQNDERFIQFDAPVWGLRALMKTLLTYQRKHELDTIESMISRWAPAHENPLRHYAWYIAKRLNISPEDGISVSEPCILIPFSRGIVSFENGHAPQTHPEDWYSSDLYTQAADMALGVTS